MANPGDLGRRLAERRLELGLSREEVAARAGIAPAYLAHLEEDPVAVASRSTLALLSVALEVTPEELGGGGRGHAPGTGPVGGRAVLEAMDRAECEAHLAQGGVGRYVFDAPKGPVAYPVNFTVLDGDVVFRTASDISLDPGGRPDPAWSFEVDRIDDSMAEGWSVLVTGEARVVQDDQERARIDATGLQPWAGDTRNVYVRLTPRQVTGRRIRRVPA
jgi:transcriptional regulator with XRE-family HTH domain